MKSHSDVGKAGYPNGLSLATYGICLLVAFIAQSKCKIMFQMKYKYK